MEEKYIVAENIRTAGLWNEADCRRLCELAGLEEEWENADGEMATGEVWIGAWTFYFDEQGHLYDWKEGLE